MDAVARLTAAESIRQTKATYWYAMDMKDWERLATVFAGDAIFDMREEFAFGAGETIATLPPIEESIAAGDPAVTVGARPIAAFIRNVVESWRTVHHGHEPVIDIDSPDEGRAIWPLFDYIDDGSRALKGYGHYHEKYRRQPDGRWLISHVRLTRIRADGEYPQMPEQAG